MSDLVINAGLGRAMHDKIVQPTFGRTFVVFNSSDNNQDDVEQLFTPVAGKVRYFESFASALAACDTNRGDTIVLNNQNTHAITAMATLSISRLNIVGLDYLLGIHRAYGQGSKIAMGVTTATADVFGIKNTGVRNSFKGIKFVNNNTLTQNVACVGEGGEYTYYEDCEIYDSTRLDSDTHAEMVLNGDSTQFKNCTIGSLADAVSGDKVRPAILLTAGTVGAGLVSRDVLFDKCNFWKQAGGTTTAMVKGSTNDIERLMEFRDTQFVANPLGSAPAVAIALGTQAVGMVTLTGNTCATGCTKIATATGVFNCTPARVGTATIGVQAS